MNNINDVSKAIGDMRYHLSKQKLNSTLELILLNYYLIYQEKTMHRKNQIAYVC